MAIENFNEVQEYINNNMENEQVKSYLGGLKKYDLEGVKSFLENDEKGKGYLQSLSDTRVTQAINSYKENHYKTDLKKGIDEELLKRNPKLTPEQLKIQELENKFEDMEKAKARAEMTSKFKDTLSEKKIPSNMIDFLLSDDEEKTNNNIASFEKGMKSYIEKMVEERLKGGYNPPKGGKADVGLISQAEWDKNKNDLDWYEKNKQKIFESRKQGLIK